MLKTLFLQACLGACGLHCFWSKITQNIRGQNGRHLAQMFDCLFFFFNDLVSALVVLQSGSVRMGRGNYCQTAPSKSLSVSGRR